MTTGTSPVPGSLQRIANFCWPSTVSEDGQVNGDALVRRMETVFGSLLPVIGTTYGILKCCCDCEYSGTISLCWALFPPGFCPYDEWRAESRAAKIQTLKEKMRPPEQIPSPSLKTAMESQEAERRRKETEEAFQKAKQVAAPTVITFESQPQSQSFPPRSPTNRGTRKLPVKTPSGVEPKEKCKTSPTSQRRPLVVANGYPSGPLPEIKTD